jgi:hypothetical protein
MVNEMLRRLTIGVSSPHEASEVVHPSPAKNKPRGPVCFVR